MRKSYPVQIRFCDVDSMGHVNNARFFEYFELARVFYFDELIGKNWDWTQRGLILARNEIDYVKPLYLDEYMTVDLWFEKTGRTSLDMRYEVYGKPTGGNPELKARARSVLVCFDYTKNTSIEIPVEWKRALGIPIQPEK